MVSTIKCAGWRLKRNIVKIVQYSRKWFKKKKQIKIVTCGKMSHWLVIIAQNSTVSKRHDIDCWSSWQRAITHASFVSYDLWNIHEHNISTFKYRFSNGQKKTHTHTLILQITHKSSRYLLFMGMNLSSRKKLFCLLAGWLLLYRASGDKLVALLRGDSANMVHNIACWCQNASEIGTLTARTLNAV